MNFSRCVSTYRTLLSLNEEDDLATTLKNIQELLSFTKKVFSSSHVAEVFAYFCLHGASTAWVLQNALNYPEATVYRALKHLRSLDIIVPAIKVRKTMKSRGGPRPTIWALEGAKGDEVAAAMRLHYQMLSPKFRVAEKVAQTILEEYVYKRSVSEITYREIVVQIKELTLPFNAPDIAELTANYLKDRGIKVWK